MLKELSYIHILLLKFIIVQVPIILLITVLLKIKNVSGPSIWNILISGDLLTANNQVKMWAKTIVNNIDGFCINAQRC